MGPVGLIISWDIGIILGCEAWLRPVLISVHMFRIMDYVGGSKPGRLSG